MTRNMTLPRMAMSAAFAALLLAPGMSGAQTAADGPPVPFEMLDANGDGTVSAAEFEAFRAERPMQPAAAGNRGNPRMGMNAEAAGARMQGQMQQQMQGRNDAQFCDQMGGQMGGRNQGQAGGRKGGRMGGMQGNAMHGGTAGNCAAMGATGGQGGYGTAGMRGMGGMDGTRGMGGMGGMGGFADAGDPDAMATQMIERFDADGDGLVSADEIVATMESRQAARDALRGRRDARFEQIDTDGDGVISPEEFEAHEAMQTRLQQGRNAPATEGDAPEQ